MEPWMALQRKVSKFIPTRLKIIKIKKKNKKGKEKLELQCPENKVTQEHCKKCEICQTLNYRMPKHSRRDVAYLQD